jgi:HEPN domain-containing protein
VLSRRCARHDEAFQAIARQCRRLDKYYITSRYPNGLPDSTPADYFDQDEAREAIALAQDILTLTEEKLSGLLSIRR